MKTNIKHYLITFLIILIPSLFLSLILATLSYFIQMNNSFMTIFIQLLAFSILIISALYFSSQFTHNRLIHCLIISILYLLLHLVIHLHSLNMLNLALKSSVFLIVGIIKEMAQKKRWIDSSFFYLYSIFKILTSYGSATPTDTISLIPWSKIALANGDSFEIFPFNGSVSKVPTIV